MAIDGNIWVLYRDGTVQTFLDGRQQPFVLETPPDGPIVEPQAIIVGSEAGTAQSLFIVDSGKSRILEYDKTGKYLRQYRPADLTDREKLRKIPRCRWTKSTRRSSSWGPTVSIRRISRSRRLRRLLHPHRKRLSNPRPTPAGEQPTAEPASP